MSSDDVGSIYCIPNYITHYTSWNLKVTSCFYPKDLLKVQRFTSTNCCHPYDPYSIYWGVRMTGNLLRGGPLRDDGTTPPLTREQIKGHLSALRSLVKEHNSRSNVSPIRLNFNEEEDETQAQVAITKIVRKANETLVAFKERWTVETCFIEGLSEVMEISSFMDAHKCPELAKLYSDNVPKTMDEMMVMLEDSVHLESSSSNEAKFKCLRISKSKIEEKERTKAENNPNLQTLNPMDDEPMWAVDRVVALTPSSTVTIPDTANEFAIKGNYMPPKRDMRLIDEHFESEYVDVSTVSSSANKIVKTIDITHKGVLCTEEPKYVMKNNFGPLIIRDWHSDDDSEDKLSPTVDVKTVKPSVEKIKSVKTPRKTVKTAESHKPHKHYPRGNKRNWNNLMSDNGIEFKNSAMTQFCDDKGIKREYSVARTPQQNVIAERRNMTLIEAARTMLVDSKLPTTFWAEAVNTAFYVLNRALVTKPHNKTPYELIRGRPPLINFMKPFGCPVTILNTKDNLGKFEGKADEGYFVGPDWLFDINSLTISMNYVLVVTGNPTNGITGTKEPLVVGQDERKKELEQEYIMIPICTTGPLISQDIKDSAEDTRKKAPEVDAGKALDNGGHENQVSRSKDGSLFQQDRQTEHNNSTNDINTVSSPVSTAGPSFVNAASPIPLNAVRPSASTNAFEEHSFERFSPFKNAFSLPHVPMVTPIDDTGIFGNAYDDDVLEEEVDMNNLDSSYAIPEATKFLKDHPQEQVIGIDLPKEKWAIGTKWVYKNKKDEKRIVIKNKAILATQGHTQEKGIDYDEVFAPVARIEDIRLFLAYASFKDLVVYQMDVKSAVLYGKIEKGVYFCQPLGFEDPNFLDKVYKVEKALYGLHQAPRAWYETLSTYLLDNGFRKGQIDKTLFIKRHKDDILLVQISYMGKLSFFLGLQVKQKSDGIFISQDKYVAEILKKLDFVTVKTASTPMESNKPLIKDEEAEDVDVHLYKSMIGSLMYLTTSRPKITFVICACARFQVTPKTSHLHAVKRIFRYIKGQTKLGLWYPKDSPFDLEAYSHSDYAGASLERKSTTGGCQFLGKRLISWHCKK
uniref:Putative ribonuclease H-like domain-containing protein n=1 Tax=Tanacetum cinerariifolium TaxID=118510 RepID=A0A6L2LEK6_TANCI|nr:putative ribonuclease H-like domain-containing protein [Tanacetum cinerariifolium]